MDYGKQFEQQFKDDWRKSFPEGFLLRLYDTTNGYKSISNPCDFIAFTEGNLFLLECKSHKGASIPFEAITQIDRLKQYVDIPNVHPSIILWLYEKDKCFYIPIQSVVQLQKQGEKSIGLRHTDKVPMFEIPSQKKRVFLTTDYKQILNFIKEDYNEDRT